MAGVAEIVGVPALGQGRAVGRFDCDYVQVLPAAQFLAQERKRDAGKVAATAGAADDDIGVIIGHFQLLHGFLADYRLVQQHVVEHAAQGIAAVVALYRPFHRLADGDAQAAGAVRVLGQHCAACGRGIAGAGDATGAEAFHKGAAVRLLVVAYFHHVHFNLQPEKRARQCQGRAPLPRAGFRGDTLHPFLFGIEGLGHGRVGLVRAGRAYAFILVIDACRRIQRLFQSPRPVQGRGPPLFEDVPHRFRDIDVTFTAHFLLNHRHREDGREVVRRDGLPGARVQYRRRRFRQVRDDVIPACGYVGFL